MIIDDDDEKIVWPRKTTMRMIDADETHRLVQKKTYERHRAKTSCDREQKQAQTLAKQQKLGGCQENKVSPPP